MKEVIKISNFPRDKIYVLLKKGYRKELIKDSMDLLNCKNYFELSSWINKKLKMKFNGGDVKYWVIGEKFDERTRKIHPKFMSLNIVIELVKLNNKDIEELQKNIISYRSGGKGLRINNPLLPIKVTPELDSIVIHLFGDGAAGDFTPSYTQKNKSAMENFTKKLENCFGNFEKSIYFTQGKYQVKFPKAITDIISKYYGITSYKSYESKIPRKILKRKDNKFKIACIISYILYEGNIRDVISLGSVNKELIYGMRNLVLDCNYKCSNINFDAKSNFYRFSISVKEIERFFNEIKILSDQFPTCNLDFKNEPLKFIIKRRLVKNPKNSKITDQTITKILKNKNLSAIEISKSINYAYCTVLHRLESLLSEGLVTRRKKGNGIYLWKLNNNYSEFPSKKAE